jgi:hypothetical protein
MWVAIGCRSKNWVTVLKSLGRTVPEDTETTEDNTKHGCELDTEFSLIRGRKKKKKNMMMMMQ